MSDNPLISICIPVYNAIDFIEETIDCFISQTYKNWEIILQDDCSTDGTWELLKKNYADSTQIKIYQNAANLGIGKNWNKAYERASGEFIVIFNADDLVVETFLEKSIAHFKTNPTIDFVISSYLKSDEIRTDDIVSIGKSYQGLTKDLININHKPFYRFSWNYTLAKKTSLDQLKNEFGLFYPTQVCDAMLWYEAYRQNLTAYYTGDIVGVYRMHDGNNSKIPLGEFESTLLWMLPIYPKVYQSKTKSKWNGGIILLIKYLYACLKYHKIPKLAALRNVLIYV